MLNLILGFLLGAVATAAVVIVAPVIKYRDAIHAAIMLHMAALHRDRHHNHQRILP